MALWLSMIPADGIGLRPADTRSGIATANSRMPTGRAGDAADVREAGADTPSGGSSLIVVAGGRAAGACGAGTAVVSRRSVTAGGLR